MLIQEVTVDFHANLESNSWFLCIMQAPQSTSNSEFHAGPRSNSRQIYACPRFRALFGEGPRSSTPRKPLAIIETWQKYYLPHQSSSTPQNF